MNEKQHNLERIEDRSSLKDVADLRSMDSSLIKGMGVCLMAILGFLAIVVFNDHSSLTGIAQWQTDYGKKIDSMTAALNMLETKTNYVPIKMPSSDYGVDIGNDVSLGSTTGKTSPLNIDP